MGAPGVGKGTQAKEIMAAWAVPQISTGDLLRSNVASQTSLGREAETVMGRGELVPDDLVNRMVAERFKSPDTARGYILDGFPRTLNQADWLDKHLADGGSGLPVVAVSIEVGYTQLLRRITGRRMCPVCGSIYNVFFQPPKVEGKCDLDGAALTSRPDDTEAVFEERMRAYNEQTAPVVEHYRAVSRLAELDGEQSVEAVTAAVKAAVHQLRGRQ